MGGDLFTAYRHDSVMYGSEEHARFYIACIALGFQHLHQRCIMYRDLKLENVVLDGRGYAKLCDFGLSTLIRPCCYTYTVCGTVQYLAPEVLSRHGYSCSADWWSLGILGYELLTGRLPFDSKEPHEIIKLTKAGLDRTNFPNTGDWPELVRGLCRRDPWDRFPMLAGGIKNLQDLSWYSKSGFAWDQLEQCVMEAPYVPILTSPEDMQNFDVQEQMRPSDYPYNDPGTQWDLEFDDPTGPANISPADESAHTGRISSKKRTTREPASSKSTPSTSMFKCLGLLCSPSFQQSSRRWLVSEFEA